MFNGFQNSYMDSSLHKKQKESLFGAYDNAPNVPFIKNEEDEKIEFEENLDSTRTHSLL